MKCSECAHWSTAAGSCYCPPETAHHIMFPGTVDPCPAYRDRAEAEADPQRCERCAWWSADWPPVGDQVGHQHCFCPRPAAQPGEGERCPEFRPGEVQINGDAGNRFTGGRGSRPWVRQPEKVQSLE